MNFFQPLESMQRRHIWELGGKKGIMHDNMMYWCCEKKNKKKKKINYDNTIQLITEQCTITTG